MHDIRRIFASTPAGRRVLTVNGLEYDYVHYRHNPDGVARVIDANHRFTPFADRLQEDGKVLVHIRVWDFDIDMIEILDDLNGEWHRLWSTDPDYTGGLSRWEHHLYLDFLAASDRGRKRQRGRVMVKAKQKFLREFDGEIEKLGIRARGKRFALIEAEERRARELADRATDQEGDGGKAASSVGIMPGGRNRKDAPTPPRQDGTNKKRTRRPSPARDADYGLKSTANLTRPGANEDADGSEKPKYQFRSRKAKAGDHEN